MSYTPTESDDQSFFTLVRGNSSWNDVIENNTSFIESSGNTIQTKNSQSIPMLAEGALSWENPNNNTDAAVWSYNLNTADSQFLWAQFRGWNGGANVVGDDKAVSTNNQSFTYTRKFQAGAGASTFVLNNAFSSVVLFFPESI